MPPPSLQVRHVSLGGGGGGGRTPYALLGWLILGEQAVSFCMLVCKVVGLRRRAAASGAVGSEGGGGGGQENVNEVDQGGKCMLCLETRRATTATPCGARRGIIPHAKSQRHARANNLNHRHGTSSNNTLEKHMLRATSDMHTLTTRDMGLCLYTRLAWAIAKSHPDGPWPSLPDAVLVPSNRMCAPVRDVSGLR